MNRLGRLDQTKKLIILYLIFAAVFGVLYMFIMPFPSVPDENRHFLKIYGMTEGVFFPSDKVSLPGNLEFPNQYNFSYSEYSGYTGLKADYSNMQWYDLSSTTLYFPLVYLPQTLGFLIAKLFTLNITAICLTGRICGYLFNVFMICLAIKLMPAKKELVFMTALLPIFMQESVSLAGDSVENAMIMVFVSCVLALREGKTDKRWPLFILAPLIGLCKMFYLPLVLLVLITNEKPRTKMLVIAESLILNVLWLLCASGQPSHYNNGADGAAQSAYIMADPFRYIVTILMTVVSCIRTWVRQAFGGNLGWISVNIFMPFILIYILMMMYIALVKSDSTLKCGGRVCILVIDISVFLIVLTGEYLQWTAVGANLIDGVQGRYFVPLIVITLFASGNRKLNLPAGHVMQAAAISAGIYNTAALIAVYRAFSGIG